MQVVAVQTRKARRQFKNFRKKLYSGDKYYVSTVEFTCDMLLKRQTDFAKLCDVKPIMIQKNSFTVAECILIRNPKDDFIQIAFFESLKNQQEAVNLILEQAKLFAFERNLKKVIVGLNGHLSYGVGLSVDISSPNTFDSLYTKPYYIDYFLGGKQHNLTAFSAKTNDVIDNLVYRKSKVEIRPIDMANYDEEMEKFAEICNQTIGTTFLYAQVEKNHFAQLMQSMKGFLKPENLLFAVDEGQVVGFIFWHPDYNEILKRGKQNSLLSIALRYILFKNKIKKVKLNAIGVKDNYQGNTTLMLLAKASEYMQRYECVETNFVWNNNKKSMLINKKLLKNEERKFKVIEYEYD